MLAWVLELCLVTEDENNVDKQLCVYDSTCSRNCRYNGCLCVMARPPEIVNFHKVDGKSASVTAP